MNKLILTTVTTLFLNAASANGFELASKDISEGRHMDRTQEFSGWGCDGSNLSPQLEWKDAPAETKSFAVTAYDPDAPTGSGFWHWVAIDLSSKVTTLDSGADIEKLGTRLVMNDYGSHKFGGACPPIGHGMHRLGVASRENGPARESNASSCGLLPQQSRHCQANINRNLSPLRRLGE